MNKIEYPGKEANTKTIFKNNNWEVTIDKSYWSATKGNFGKMPEYFECRKNNTFCEENFFQVGVLTEHVWWNRPLENKKDLYGKESDGIISTNLPLSCRDNPEKTYKALFNVLLPQDAVLTLSSIKFNEKWTEEDKLKLRAGSYQAVKDLVTSLGYGDRIESKSNDLFFDGKKFSGLESTYDESTGYKENIVITCYYNKYKEVFDRLVDNGIKRGITGICDEIPELTPEMIVNAIKINKMKLFNEIIER